MPAPPAQPGEPHRPARTDNRGGNVRSRVHCQLRAAGARMGEGPAGTLHDSRHRPTCGRGHMLSILDRHAIGQLLRTKEIDAWGVAANTPRLPLAPDYPIAISMLMRVDQLVVRGLRHGPTEDYYQEYLRLNLALDDATETLVDVLRAHGHAAERVVATGADDGNGAQALPAQDGGDECRPRLDRQDRALRSPQFGPAVRLATVFTDLDLPVRRRHRRGPLRRLPRLRRRLPGGLRARRAVARRHGSRRALRRRRLPSPDDALRRRRRADLRHLHRRLPVHAASLAARRAGAPPARPTPRRRCASASRLLRSASLQTENGFQFQMTAEARRGARRRPDRRDARRARPAPHAPEARRSRRGRRGVVEREPRAGLRRRPRALPRTGPHDRLSHAGPAQRDRRPAPRARARPLRSRSCPPARRTATPSSAAVAAG